jgi:hypothetical protein
LEAIKRQIPLSVAIPSSIIADTPHLREKTYKVGLIGRACAIFRVDEIVIYPDGKGQNTSNQIDFVSNILSYMETPQYLRKRIFPVRPLFKYLGILPPLRTPHHPIAKYVRDLKLNEYREGIVIKSEGNRSHVDIGAETTAVLQESKLPIGKRVTVRLVSLQKEHPKVCLARREEIGLYWGYNVTASSLPLGRTIGTGSYDLAIATSRYGTPLTQVAEEVRQRYRASKRVLIAFGSPSEGLKEILRRENLKVEDVFDFTVNVIERQGTKTVRTEEAVFASLTALEMIS